MYIVVTMKEIDIDKVEIDYPEGNIPWYFRPELYSNNPQVVRLMVARYEQEERERENGNKNESL